MSGSHGLSPPSESRLPMALASQETIRLGQLPLAKRLSPFSEMVQECELGTNKAILVRFDMNVFIVRC